MKQETVHWDGCQNFCGSQGWLSPAPDELWPSDCRFIRFLYTRLTIGVQTVAHLFFHYELEKAPSFPLSWSLCQQLRTLENEWVEDPPPPPPTFHMEWAPWKISTSIWNVIRQDDHQMTWNLDWADHRRPYSEIIRREESSAAFTQAHPERETIARLQRCVYKVRPLGSRPKHKEDSRYTLL